MNGCRHRDESHPTHVNTHISDAGTHRGPTTTHLGGRPMSLVREDTPKPTCSYHLQLSLWHFPGCPTITKAPISHRQTRYEACHSGRPPTRGLYAIKQASKQASKRGVGTVGECTCAPNWQGCRQVTLFAMNVTLGFGLGLGFRFGDACLDRKFVKGLSQLTGFKQKIGNPKP